MEMSLKKKLGILLLLAAGLVGGYRVWVDWYGGGDFVWYAGTVFQEKLLGRPYAGSVSCRECHERFHELWSTSWHGLAQQPYNRQFAMQSLLPQKEPIVVGKKSYLADIDAGVVVETSLVGTDLVGTSPNGTSPIGTRRYPISQVLGGKNVYFFLTEFEKGHLQTLPTGFDSRRGEWFDVQQSAVRHHGELPDSALHWTDRTYTYNTSCYSCHVSQLSTNYSPGSDSYATTWAEPGINCETCHGSATEHVKVCKLAGRRSGPRDVKITQWGSFTREQVNDNCGFCHAKMIPLTKGFIPGERYFDHYDLATLENHDYYPDGRELGECYTFTAWKMGGCAKGGKLDCIHCHTSSGRYRFHADSVANNACAPCHMDKVEDPASHTHHEPGQVRCIDCHMPKTEFGRMKRSDHSMRPPTPAASARFGSPDACILCHAGKKPLWADSCVRRWHEHDYQRPVLYRAELLDEARRGNWNRLDAMLDCIADSSREEVYANSLVRLLRDCDNPRKWPVLLAAMTEDPSPLIRGSAAEVCTGHYTGESIRALLHALRDDFRLVRIRAASALAGAPREGLLADPVVQRDIRRAEGEFMDAVLMRLDDANNRLVLGNYHQSRGDVDAALEEFEAAIRLRPGLITTWINAALAYNQKGDWAKAERYLLKAIELDSSFAVAHQNLALLLGEQGRLSEAAERYRTALSLDSTLAVSAYNLAVISDRQGAIGDAVAYSGQAARFAPQDMEYAYTAAYYLWRTGKEGEAEKELDRVLESEPNHEAAIFLKAEIRKGRR